ncbi:hypothetical protein QJS10_CPB18g01624 [Acorus calamus]|uniref:QLQ domain-containing protein n=1 Tax=Acorus calamus TaxID=4465 RepID=A0AAV9CNT0_ACOCL|nr:hypothetical protein QJS10_CPB18g01624 [Acorus calamus]
MHPPPRSADMAQRVESSNVKNTSSGPKTPPQTQYLRQMQQSNASASQSPAPSSGGPSARFSYQSRPISHTPPQHVGFTKLQLRVLEAQIHAFIHLRRREALPWEVLQFIAPPPLDLQQQKVSPLCGTVNLDHTAGKSVEEPPEHIETNEKASQVTSFSKGHCLPEEETFSGEKASMASQFQRGAPGPARETIQVESVSKPEHPTAAPVSSEQEVQQVRKKVSVEDVMPADKGKTLPRQVSAAEQMKKSTTSGTTPPPNNVGTTRKYSDPLFDFPCFAKTHHIIGSMTSPSSLNTMVLAYDVKNLCLEESIDVLNRKKNKKLEEGRGFTCCKSGEEEDKT